jgi:putative spermidine/putrescine transport system permease protein
MKDRAFWRYLILTLFTLFMVIPLIATLLFSVSTRWDHTILPEGLTLQWWLAATGRRAFGLTLKNSFIVAFWTVLLSVILVTPTAFWAHLRVPKGKPLIELMTILPFGIPGVILALALIRFYSDTPIKIVNTPVILIAACMVISLPFMYRPVANALNAIDVRTLAEAGLSLGAGWRQILISIVIPNIMPGVINGSLLVFSTVFAEFTLANLLVGTRFKTFPIYLVEFTRFDGRQASALAVISFTVAWLTSFLILRVTRGRSNVEEAAGAR